MSVKGLRNVSLTALAIVFHIGMVICTIVFNPVTRKSLIFSTNVLTASLNALIISETIGTLVGGTSVIFSIVKVSHSPSRIMVKLYVPSKLQEDISKLFSLPSVLIMFKTSTSISFLGKSSYSLAKISLPFKITASNGISLVILSFIDVTFSPTILNLRTLR